MGATSHISLNKADFADLKPIALRNIRGVDRSSIHAIGTGSVRVKCKEGRRFMLKDNLYTPQATLQLISVGQLGNEGCTTVFEARQCRVLHDNQVIAQGHHKGKSLYKLQGNTQTAECANIAHVTPSLETWHRQLGHVNYATIMEMARNRSVTGMHTDLSTLPPMC